MQINRHQLDLNRKNMFDSSLHIQKTSIVEKNIRLQYLFIVIGLIFIYNYFLFMNKKGQKSLSLVFLLLLNSLFASVHPFGWQGTGNMSKSNLTEIWDFIENNPILESQDISTPDNFCQQLSGRLNGLWGPAWNVVTMKSFNLQALYDAVLYGYAFRDHWMWYNDYRVGDKIYSFVIWKDYNCDPNNWVQLSVEDSRFNQLQQAQIDIAVGQITQVMLDDVWDCAKQFIDYLSLQTPFLGSGLSVVMAKDTDYKNYLYSSICSVTGKFYQGWMFGQGQGVFLLFRTR